MWVVAVVLLSVVLASDLGAADRSARSHTIFLTALEVKGATSADKLAPPSVNPKDLSKGYDFKPPGVADKNAPQRWEVSSYMFSPAFVTVKQGDEVVVNVFVVNGDEHEVQILAPDGAVAMAKTTWNRGREYRTAFVATETGSYQLVCSTHAPTMVATFAVLPR